MAEQHAINPSDKSSVPLAKPHTMLSSISGFFRGNIGLKVFTGIVLLGVWEVGVRIFAAPFVAKPSGVILAIPSVLGSAEVWAAAWATLSAVVLGLAIALVFGVLIGVAMGRVRAVNHSLEIWVNSFYAMPMVAVLPLLTMWFGYDQEARFATIIFAALFSIIINVADGVSSTPQSYIEVARSFRARAVNIWFGISLYASIPHLIAGIRLAIGRALVGAVLAEIFASVQPGIGMYILANARAFHQNEAMVAVLILAAFGISMDILMNWILKKYFPWYRREGT